MNPTNHAHAALIEAIGSALIREKFAVSHQRLYLWRKRGIPHTHRAAIAQMAMLAGLPIPADFLSPPAKQDEAA